MKRVTDTLGLARSNIAERVKGARPQRGPQTAMAIWNWRPISAALSTRDQLTGTGGSPRSSSASGDLPVWPRLTPNASIG
jgi:hypothetical protein